MGKLAEIVGDGNLKDTINAISIDDNKMSVDEQIEFYIKNKMPFMLHGMSGVGKSRRIKDIDPDYVSIYLRNGMVPEEVIGKTIYPNNDTTQVGKWIAPSWYGDLCEKCEREKDKVHVLFIDELTNAKETVQSFAYHLVLEHSIAPNLGKLPDNCVVVCAGNSRDESEAANIIPEPLFRRFVAHIYLEPKVSDWVQWGQKIDKDTGHDRIHPIVRAFVSYNNKLFCSKYDPENPPKYALDPRAWEQVSDVIYANGGKIAIEIIENKIGKENAKKFRNFAKQYVPITVQDILSGDYAVTNLPTRADEIIAFILTLTNATNEQVSGIRDFISNQYGNEFLTKYDLAWIGDDPERALIINAIKKQKEESKKLMQTHSNSPKTTESQGETNEQSSPSIAKSNYKISMDDFVKDDNTKFIAVHNFRQAAIVGKALEKHNKKWIWAWTRECYWAFNPYNDNAYDAIQNKWGVKPTDTIYYSNQGDYFRDGAPVISNNQYTYDISEVDMSADLSASDQELLDKEIYGDNNLTTSGNPQSNTQAVQVSGQPTHKYTIDEFLNSKDRMILQIDINSDDMFAQKFIKEIKKKTQIKGVPTAKQFAEQEGNVLNFNNFDSRPCETCEYRVFEIEDVDFSKYLTESELMFLYHENPPTTYKLSLDEFFNSNKDVAIKVTGYEHKQLIKQTMEDCGHDFGDIGNAIERDRTKLFKWLPFFYVLTAHCSPLSSQEYSKMLGVEDIDMSSIPALADAYKKYMAKNNYTNKPIDYQEIFKCI